MTAANCPQFLRPAPDALTEQGAGPPALSLTGIGCYVVTQLSDVPEHLDVEAVRWEPQHSR